MKTAKIVVYGRDREFTRRLAAMVQDGGFEALQSYSLPDLGQLVAHHKPDLVIFDHCPDDEDVSLLPALMEALHSAIKIDNQSGMPPALLALIFPTDQGEVEAQFAAAVNAVEVPNTPDKQGKINFLYKPILHAYVIKMIREILAG